MTKAERLIFLVKVIKSRKVVTVPEMSRVVGVSQRTVYRDLATLSRMSIPIHFDNGYRLSHRTELPFAEMSDDDLQLLRFCLRRNPLAGYPYFMERFEMIDRRVCACLQRAEHGDLVDVIESEPLHSLAGRDRELEVTGIFLRAIFENRKVVLVFRFGRKHIATAAPLAIRLNGKVTVLVVTTGVNGHWSEIPVDDLEAVRITADGFDRNLLMRTRKEALSDRKNLTKNE